MTTYSAITIGPIYETIKIASTPAGMWAASYIFSHISRLLCKGLIEKGLVESEEKILTPYYSNDSQLYDGVGRYCDHIVFEPKNKDKEAVLSEVSKLFDEVAQTIAEAIDKNQVEWLKQYFQFHAICFESDGFPTVECGALLDAIELERSFPTVQIADENPMASLLDNRSKNRNTLIREKIRDAFCKGNWPFTIVFDEKTKDLPDMNDISGRSRENKMAVPVRQKINSYYAIVQVDGDRFGKYVTDCINRKETERKVSEKVYKYCTKEAQLVKGYGGIPIYASGDDFLFIAPLTAKADGCSDTLAELLVKLREMFDEEFGKSSETTLSFGVAIRYNKYPLYEAFDETYHCLCKAKETRNAMAISLQKHSGQTSEFVINGFKTSGITGKLLDIIKRNMDGDVLQSIQSKLWEFERLVKTALILRRSLKATNTTITDKNNPLKNVFDNTFDCDIHDANRDDIDAARVLLETISDECHGDAELTDRTAEETLKQFDNMLRFAKFYGEKGDDSND